MSKLRAAIVAACFLMLAIVSTVIYIQVSLKPYEMVFNAICVTDLSNDDVKFTACKALFAGYGIDNQLYNHATTTRHDYGDTVEYRVVFHNSRGRRIMCSFRGSPNESGCIGAIAFEH